MKHFLTSSFGVREYHSLIQQFESLDNFTLCYKDCLKNEHVTFKRGGKIKNPDIVIQDGENLDREDRLRDREPSDDELKRGLRERIIRYVISGEKGEELEGEVITQSQAHVIQDESTIGSRKVAFSAFVKVVSSSLALSMYWSEWLMR